MSFFVVNRIKYVEKDTIALPGVDQRGLTMRVGTTHMIRTFSRSTGMIRISIETKQPSHRGSCCRFVSARSFWME
jgi:hypothetical protein